MPVHGMPLSILATVYVADPKFGGRRGLSLARRWGALDGHRVGHVSAHIGGESSHSELRTSENQEATKRNIFVTSSDPMALNPRAAKSDTGSFVDHGVLFGSGLRRETRAVRR